MNTPRTEAKASSIIGFWSCATVPSEFARELERENIRIRDAAQAVIERWESPAWKDNEPTAAVIYRLRDALYPPKEGK